MNKLFFLLLFLLSITMYSQETDNFSIPNYAPKSPEAAAFLQYGQYPVNLSTGVPNISIPIYTVSVDGFSLPITLDYHARGIKVNQQATWVGLGWNLNYGAQIILNVRGEVDEKQSFPDVPSESLMTEFYQIHKYRFELPAAVEQSQERDIFMFSSPTVNGQFYYKPSTQEYIVYPPDAFKVEKAPNDIEGSVTGSMIKITDSSGNIYKLKTFEKSFTKFNHNEKYTSAWYVDEIETPGHEFINFYYDDDGVSEEYNFYYTSEISKFVENCGDCIYKDENPYKETKTIGLIKKMDQTTLTDIKRIREISFNNGISKIMFDKVNGREDLKTGLSYGSSVENYTQSKLSFIRIFNRDIISSQNYNYVKGYELKQTYFKDQQGFGSGRLRLDEVVDLIEGTEGHEFRYSDEKFTGNPNSQDYYGYYNGSSNLNDLIPPHHLTEPYVWTVGSASRGVNPSKAVAETLTEIHYPTKGWTKFNYESNEYYDPDNLNSITFSEGGAATGIGPGGLQVNGVENPGEPYTTITGCNDCVQYYTIPFAVTNPTGATAEVFTNIYNTAPNNSQTQVKNKYGRIRVISNGYTVYDTDIYHNQAFSETVSVDLEPGSGYFVVEAWGNYLHAGGNITFHDEIPEAADHKGAGLRIASIENYDKESDVVPQTRKEYSYRMPYNDNMSSGIPVNPEIKTDFTTRKILTFKDIVVCNSDPNPYTPTDYTHKTNYTESYNITSNGRYGIKGDAVVYKYVKETNIDMKDLSKNGYSLYNFTTEGDWYVHLDGGIIPTPWKRGKILEKTDFKTVGVNVYPLRKEVNTYVEDNAKKALVEGYKIKRFTYGQEQLSENAEYPTEPPLGFLPGCDMLASDQNFIFYCYDMGAFWNYLGKTEVTENFYDSQNVLKGTLTTSKKYFYDNPLHMQLSREEITTSKGESFTTKYYYPLDAECANEPEVAMLNAKHMLNVPLKVENFRNGAKLGGTKTIYKKWCDNNDPNPTPTDPGFRLPAVGNLTSGIIVRPELIQSFKGNDAPETRLRTTKVDCDGNVLELKQEGGMVISYIYGYDNRLPVAKIENYNYDAISSTIIEEIKAASDSGNETILQQKLTALRDSVSSAFVTTYTYEYPLLGVSSVTDPRGRKTSYMYDSEGRLTEVKDSDGNLLQENIYHFKP